ncbi:acyl-CoA synthetase [Psychrobium sp. 1_MG-2023]|uniref:acyl-CoA synthetase n=1 Tax=Psychrobium sp. 1_MG-2023 TaxID=3062624 RepID=UPI000C34E0F6|nr:acyl-CoA synthetase [Psychrobium sp. 1_MG-2023]MDP2559650.1 acyl-CoA synthetase [Psychrobium sp. 1_MG-2023]PKF59481.1 acyl-CoA synthetase [Alteromonadales bacterium alter-6D02]
MSNNIFEQYLEQNQANYVALTPVSFLERAAFVYPNNTATINGDIRRSWREVFERCCKLASALNKRGINRGDTVSIIAPNISEHFEAHFAVPMSGAVLNSINTRLDAEAIAFILAHAQSKVLITDKEFSAVVKKAVRMLPTPPLVIDINDPYYTEGELIGSLSYDELLAEGDSDVEYFKPSDEWDAITLNYTSGTTGDPKGVVYHYRGAYLNAVSNMMSWGMTDHPVYLWTLPMFHCNGWCFPWTIAATAGTSVSLRHVRAEPIFELIKTEKVGYFCGAPIVLNMLNGVDVSLKSDINHTVKVMTAGAPPPAAVIEGMEASGFKVTHVYGLTETYGPSVVCAWHDEWNEKNSEQQAKLKSRQGVRSPMLDQLMVANPDTLEPVPQDGSTIGEIFMRGNLVMKGYLKNPSTTQAAFKGGWLHSGDLAVWHSDGYVEIKDRSKDVIISGGENISSVEVEDVLYRYPKIQEVAVVAKPDKKWGETPCAFVTPIPGSDITQNEIIRFCRDNMAHFKVPKTIVFGDLPKTSTGKVQKFLLRQRAIDLT